MIYLENEWQVQYVSRFINVDECKKDNLINCECLLGTHFNEFNELVL